ncbi:hypothetical protein HPP92_012871 [Vanilla planifolia]|uniref:Uncharacterized protein n=1 Tax=Vanilla planifolia TaxID=51239 RepID=A0A835R2G5_VANPL|nr:hypothetical protein HPP92_012871 [Vanilla planifolia]
MEDFSAPSFSLGLDLDVDIADVPTEDEEEEANHLQKEESFHEALIEKVDDHWEAKTLDETQDEEPSPLILKRLRRGPQKLASAAATVSSDVKTDCSMLESHTLENLNDEIEEFSSPEKETWCRSDDFSSTQRQKSITSTKFSLMHHGFLKSNSGVKGASMITPASSGASCLVTLEASNDKTIFPRLTISPIRKINLVDSDSDESLTNRDERARNVDASSAEGRCLQAQNTSSKKQNFQSNKYQTESFWEGFSPAKNFKLATPALDEFCKEYFSSFKNQNMNQQMGETNASNVSTSKVLSNDGFVGQCDGLYQMKNSTGKMGSNWDFSSAQPPAYRYFCHTNPSIQALIRQRFPHFIPIGLENNNKSLHLGAENIDHMGQSNSKDACGKVCSVRTKAAKTSSSKRRNNHKCSNDVESLDPAGTWVTPKRKSSIPKDAGKRRISAVGHQSGYWFTNQDGRKVYVNKEGEELSGQMAYKQYKKDSGGFKKSKRKVATAKKPKR